MKRQRKVSGQHHGIQVVTLCISTTLVLIFLGVMVLSVMAARGLSSYVKENMTVNLILADSVSNEDALTLAGKLKLCPYAKEVRYISQDDALQVMRAELGDDPVEFAGVNPFQGEIELQLRASYANSDSLHAIKTALGRDKRVEEVVYAQSEIDAVDRNVNRINLVLLILAAIHIIICFTLVSNAVQLGVYSRRATIRTMKLVGAPWSMILRPFIRKSLLVALVSALMACLAIGAGLYTFHSYHPGAMQFVGATEMLITACAVVLFAFAVMVICTLMAVKRYLV